MLKMASTDSDCSDEGSKSFKDRLEDMPAYTMTLSNLELLYSTLRGRNAYLQTVFYLGESMVGVMTSVAKPVAVTATGVAFKVAKPVIGEVRDPVASIDDCASEILGKVQEKIPYFKQYPSEIVQGAKSSAKDTAMYYLDKVQSLTITKNATKSLDNVIAFSDLVVELCFPTDGSDEDIKELEKAEEDESKGVIVHARNLQVKALRRSTKKLMTYRPVQMTVSIVVPVVQYAQNRITQTTGRILQGTRFASVSTVPNQTVRANTSSEEELLTLTEEETKIKNDLASKSWDSVYKTSMFIPKKALEVTGDVYVSAKEMVFAYSNTHTIKEMPRCVYNMAESYKNNVDDKVTDVKDKALAFVYVPAQVVSSYIQSNPVVQWIIPSNIKTESIQVVNTLNHASSIK